MKAWVYKSTGSWYVVKTSDGKFGNARIKGRIKLDEITATNPVAVGDLVELDAEPDTENFIITEITERKNHINRQAPGQRMHQHVVAANIDQALVFATLREPKTSSGFIDRYLVACEAYHIPAIIIFNKSDLYRNKEMEIFQELDAIYRDIGYKVVLMSIPESRGIEEVKNLLKDKTSLISGHSGVGKSSFINAVFPERQLKTQEVSGWSGKGMHTTTFAEMFDLPFGGRIIDTPGMREFGIKGIENQELSHYFPEMRKLINDCQFNNCLHVNEPGCAVKKGLEEGKVSVERYVSYCNILESLDNRTY
jgi:ribosome biogenesis GTPase